MSGGLVKDTERVGPWTMTRMGSEWYPGMGYALGYEVDGKLIAGVAYTDWNGASLQMHVAAEPGRRWLRREFLFTSFWYPFEQLRCRKVLGVIAASNADSLAFARNLGFTLEATLKDAHPNGDLLVHSMTREQCKWLSKETYHGETLESSSA